MTNKALHNQQKTPEEILKKNIQANSKIILGLSGGPDSVFLLDICLTLNKKHPFEIIIAHINHNLRGHESDLDAEFAEQLAKKHSLKYEHLKIDKPKKGNLEEELRIIRYDFFEKTRKKHQADWILTAHHLNDNIETILLNFTRGAFIDGLSGMATIDTKRHLLRPLLSTSKEQILKKLKEQKLAYRVDESNNNTDFSRNMIRHHVVPSLKKINQNLEKTVSSNLESIKELQFHTESMTNKWIRQHQTKNGIKLQSFLDLDPFMKKNVLYNLYKNKYGNTKKITREHIQQMLDICAKNRAGLKKEFGRSFEISISKPIKQSERFIQILKKTAK